MAEAREHGFLSRAFLEVLEEFSQLKLYGYTEAERRKFDFACVLKRDWDRPLVGQTLWKHTKGVDKDLRLLLTEPKADIWPYIARDNIKNRALLYEVVHDFRNSSYKNQLYKLKVFWIPQDFDADSERDREVIRDDLKSAVVQDILFNVIFGNLTSDDIRFFLSATGIQGLNLAVLYEVATRGFVNYPDLSDRLSVSPAPLRERILNLLGSGFLWQLGQGSSYYVSLRGRVFLELLHRLTVDFKTGHLTPELRYILSKLEIEPTILPFRDLIDIPGWTPRLVFALLLRTVDYATTQWYIDLSNMSYKIHQWEAHRRFRIVR